MRPGLFFSSLGNSGTRSKNGAKIRGGGEEGGTRRSRFLPSSPSLSPLPNKV